MDNIQFWQKAFIFLLVSINLSSSPFVFGIENKNNAIKYIIREDDNPANLLVYLDYPNVLEKNGALDLFYAMNPQLKKGDRLKAGMIVWLPLGFLKRNPHKWKMVEGFLVIEGPDRKVASEKQEAGDEDFFDSLALEKAFLKLRVEKGSPIHKKLDSLGFTLKVDKKQTLENVEVIIPLKKKEPTLSDIKSERSWQTRIGLLTGSNLIRVEDELQSHGTIGNESMLGVEFEIIKKFSRTHLGVNLSGISESLENDNTIQVSQENNIRAKAQLLFAYYFSRSYLELSGGLKGIPAFLSTSRRVLESKYVYTPFVNLSYHFEVLKSESWLGNFIIGGGYYFQKTEKQYRFGNGYNAFIGTDIQYSYLKGMSWYAKLKIGYEDYNPDIFNETEMGIEVTIGHQWEW